MLASCDLSSFILMFMTKVCKGESRKNENRDWVGGRGGGGDFGKRAFPYLSCTLIISRSELNPDLTEIRLHFSNFRCRSDKRCG